MEHLTIIVNRVAKSGSITITITLTGLGGMYVIAPKLFSDEFLKPMQYGLILTDGAIRKEGYPMMGTNQLWQAITWPLIWLGRTTCTYMA